jgi:oligopeptide transport system ATP-binding protein
LRSEILEILKRHRDTRGTGYLFITHDLALASYLCDRIAVMFRGKLVELGPTETVITNPLHPYTKMLLQAVEELAPLEPHKPEDYQVSDHRVQMEESYANIIPELREVAPDHYVAHPPNRQATPDQAVPDKED